MDDFALWLEQERDRRGWSRKEAARRAGVSASMWNKVANGLGKPGMGFFQGVAQAYHMRVDEVVQLSEAGRLGEGKVAYDAGNRRERLIDLFGQLDESDQDMLLLIAQRLAMLIDQVKLPGE